MVTTVLSSDSFAKAFASTANLASRPSFELQFNNLQNAVIDRLNKKIQEAAADSGLRNNIDVFLLNEEKKLTRFQNALSDFTFDNGRNINAVGELARQLGNLSAALDVNDTTAFNNVLATINDVVSKTVVTEGTTVGIFSSDGISQLRRDGLLNFDNGGTITRATSRDDFANDAAANAAITSALEKVSQIATALLAKAEGAELLRQRTEKNLNATILQIQAAQVAQDAEKANEIAKLKEEYSQLLNAISLAFESSQALTEQLSAKLFSPNDVPAGSAVNILL
jgi:hypothetical protein